MTTVVKVIGHLSTKNMVLPAVNSHIYSIKYNNQFYREPNKKYLETADSILKSLEKVSSDITVNGTALLLEIISNINGKTLILTHDDISAYYWFDIMYSKRSDVYDNRMKLYEILGLGYVESLADIEKCEKNIMIGNMNKFSEGINLIMFVNMILLCGNASHERLRQCVGRLVRSNHIAQSVSVYYITENINQTLLSSVPREVIHDNMKHLSKKTLSITYRPFEIKSNASDEEKVVLLTSAAKPLLSIEWIKNRNALISYTEEEILKILKRK